MKIKSMTQKTALEVTDNDVLVIEDDEETKQITVADLRDYLLSSGVTKETKKLINQTLDTISATLLAAKYIVSELQSYEVTATVIDQENIHFMIKDMITGLYLTASEIGTLLMDEYLLQILIADVYVNPDMVPVIVDEYPTLDAVIPNGIIKAHFADLTQNEVAGITYDDIKIEIPETEEFRYEFLISPELFINNVSYVEEVE